MLITPRHTSKLSLLLLFCFTFVLTIFLSLSWVSAKEKPKPKPEAWQINGIVAALDDGYDGVKKLAFDKFNEYDLKDLKSVVQKPDDIAQKVTKILKDKSISSDVRSGAAEALGNLGDAAKPYLNDILNILKSDDSVSASAARALGNLGDAAKPYAQDLANILKDKKDKTANFEVRANAARALGNLREAAKPYAQDLANILKDQSDDPFVRGGAAEALANLEEAAQPYVQDILAFLKDKTTQSDVYAEPVKIFGNLRDIAKPHVQEIAGILKDQSLNSEIRGGAAIALGNLGDVAKPYIQDIVGTFKEKSLTTTVYDSAAEALGNLGDAAKPYVNEIAKILKDKSLDSPIRASAVVALANLGEAAKIADILKDKSDKPYVRTSAAEALGNLGEAAKPYIKDIADILKDKSDKPYVRTSAVVALANLGEATKSYIKEIDNILKDKSDKSDLRKSAAVALTNLGKAAKPYAQDINDILTDIIKDKSVDSGVRTSAAEALAKIRKLELKEVVVILNNFYEPGNSEYLKWRFLTYFFSGATEEVKTLLRWLGDSQAPPKELTRDEGVKILKVFLKGWNNSQGLERLRNDLAKQISEVAANKGVRWKLQDIGLLKSHYNNLKQANSTHANAVQSAIDNLQGWQWFVRSRNTIIIHIVFWLALIFAYPKFPQIQAIFFWNPWVRRILGVGYVGFLLTWFPPFRRKLFEPFKPSLLADAGLDNFHDQSYFPQSQVKVPGSGDIRPITAAIPKIQGQIILEGDSGLGKSMFLRHLLQNSQRIVVYLPAQKCHKGVIEAIQDKLHGQAQDADFLKNLIYSGAIDICIDGLNEVTAETRAKICQFVESYFRGNIIMTTQPLEWTPPSTAKTYYLQPLEQNQIQEFLLSRQSRLPKDALVQGKDYEIACIDYLKEVLTTQQPEEELKAARRILSNPMDLTVVALMLSQGKHPNLFRLQEQQYNLMAAEYLKEWNQEFPLKKFAAAVYEMRMQDKQALPADEFYQVVMSLEDEKYKMAVSRQWQDDKGEAKKEWYFRHDKIMDFFLVQNFLGETAEAEALLVDRMGDPRFRGVYFLLATLLPLDAAKELREKLIQYAADTKDNTVSNTFVQLLRTR